MTQTTTATPKKSRDWFCPAEQATVWISDGETRNTAKFSPNASDETIVREYLTDYGYTDPEELFGKWNEGWISRDGGNNNEHFYWRLIGEQAKRGPYTGGHARYAYNLRFSRPTGELRADGYRY